MQRLPPAAADAGTGRPTTARRAPDGQYRLRVTLRDEGRSAIVQKTMNVDTRAPRSEVCIGFRCTRQGAEGNIVSQGDREVQIYVKGVSPRYATRFRRLPHRPGQAARGRRAAEHPGRAHRLGLGRAGRRQAAGPGDLPRPVRGARHGGQRRHHARRVRASAPIARPPGPDRARARRPAAAAAGHRGPAGGVLRRLARRAVPLARAAAWATRRSASAAARPSRVLAFRAPDGPVRRLPARAALGPLAHDGAVPRAGREALEGARGRPDDQLARHRQGRRPAVRRPAEHALRRRHGALAARVRGRGRAARPGSRTTSRRCSSSSTAAGSGTTSPVTSTSTSRATRAPSDREGVLFAGSERWVTRSLGAAAAQVRHRRRPRRAVRRRLDAPRRAAARAATPRTPGRCCARHAADGDRPVRRARSASRATLSAPATLSQFEGDAGVRADGGRARPAGLHGARGVRRSSSGPSAAGGRRPAAERPRRRPRARRPARRHVSCARR